MLYAYQDGEDAEKNDQRAVVDGERVALLEEWLLAEWCG